MEILKQLLDYFIKHHADICALYKDRYILLYDDRVVYDSDSWQDVYSEAVYRKMHPGTFAIYHCSGSQNDYTTVIPRGCKL